MKKNILLVDLKHRERHLTKKRGHSERERGGVRTRRHALVLPPLLPCLPPLFLLQKDEKNLPFETLKRRERRPRRKKEKRRDHDDNAEKEGTTEEESPSSWGRRKERKS